MTKPVITQELVRSLFDYHEDGYLIWKASRVNRVGCRAGHFDKGTGYYRLGVMGRNLNLHRVIFIWHHGYNPENCVDHIDRDPTNNRIENLREITKQCNGRNCNLRSTNVSGITGVSSYGGSKWIAQITVNGKHLHLGVFASITAAAFARHNKEVELNWAGCNSTSSAYLYLKELGEI